MLMARCEDAPVKYRVASNIHDMSHCPESQCRSLQVAAYACFSDVAQRDVSDVPGRAELARYGSSNSHHRPFYSNCGSNILAALITEPDDLCLALGFADGDPKCPSGHHIFVGSKAAWHRFDDQASRFLDLPEGSSG